MARAEQGRHVKKAGEEWKRDKAAWGKERQMVQSATKHRLEECSQAPSCFGSPPSHVSFPDSVYTFICGGLGNAPWSTSMLLFCRLSVSYGAGDRYVTGVTNTWCPTLCPILCAEVSVPWALVLHSEGKWKMRLWETDAIPAHTKKETVEFISLVHCYSCIRSVRFSPPPSPSQVL